MHGDVLPAIPAITISPNPALSDEPVRIRLSGFTPGQRVTLRAAMADDAGQRWRSWAEFAANEAGAVDVATAEPLSGSYSGVDAMGLFWSMERVDAAGAPATFARTTTNPLSIAFTAEVNGQIVATTHHTRLGMAAGVRRVEARERGLVGTLFLPPDHDHGPHPGVIVLGGSSGGRREPLAALLASHGCAALALAYFGAEGLPPRLADIPLEYFEAALDWMAARPEVRGGRCALLGTSRGAELALLLGATFPQVGAVVAYAPSGVLWGAVGASGPAWTYRGEPLPVVPDRVPPELDAAISAREPISAAEWYLHNLEDEAALGSATIAVERIAGPVLLISGEDDQMWPSTLMAERIMRRLAEHHFTWPYRHLRYPDAGHLLSPPWQPTTVNSRRHPTVGATFAYGGTPAGQAHANADSWRKVLEWLGAHMA
ncbi:MAG TPA: acyl-CoA thioester hydrolase/BAAT C-terminal domain-containing protein [Ktedonobacterales bacterium]|nr:acyl-CoA thioester hydrolase/BAAT C-terminal domain-containing protein [Ktedonobacterales bacterium]